MLIRRLCQVDLKVQDSNKIPNLFAWYYQVRQSSNTTLVYTLWLGSYGKQIIIKLIIKL